MKPETKEMTVSKLLDIIKQKESCSASAKDEIKVMRTMLNDDSYSVDVYKGTGKVNEFNPCKAMRNMCSNILSSAAHIPMAEANTIMNKYTFKRSDASNMVDITKEFVNTYLHSGRKLNLGGREKSDVALVLKEIPAGDKSFPHCVGTDKNGNKKYEMATTFVNGYEIIKVFARAPEWVKK